MLFGDKRSNLALKVTKALLNPLSTSTSHAATMYGLTGI